MENFAAGGMASVTTLIDRPLAATVTERTSTYWALEWSYTTTESSAVKSSPTIVSLKLMVKPPEAASLARVPWRAPGP